MTNKFSPETQRLYDEMTHILRSALREGDADDAIGCLDALLSAERDDNLTEAAGLIRSNRGAMNGAEWPDHCADLLLLAARTTPTEGTAVNFTRHTTEDGHTTYTVDSFDDETTASLEFLASADPAVVRVDWIGVRVTILDTPYKITAISDDHRTATLTKVQQ